MVARPPVSSGRRRAGFSRRDSNLALLGALFTGVLIAFSLLLLLMQRVNPEFGGRLRAAMLDALQPVLSVARAPVDAARIVGQTVHDHWRVVEENRRLRERLSAVRADIARTDALRIEVERLEALVGMRRPERRLVAAAMASASPVTATRRSAIINVGLSDGVLPRMPVIAAEGLAGRVTDVGSSASRIMLLTDAASRVPVKVMRNGWTGLAVGKGSTLLDFTYDVASGMDEIRVGDRLVTSGDGGLFPPGIPVAVIIATDAQSPRARALANPANLGPVMVEAPWLPVPRFLNADPAPPEADLPSVAVTPSGGAIPPVAIAPLSVAQSAPAAPQ